MRRTQRDFRGAGALLAMAVLTAPLQASGSCGDLRDRRLLRAESSLAGHLLALPWTTFSAIGWPLRAVLVWAEDGSLAGAAPSPAVCLAGALSPRRAAALHRDNDDLAVPEPEGDVVADYTWWDGSWHTAFYPARRLLDVGVAIRSLAAAAHLLPPREAANLNALDEVPDSTWFTNRHATRRLPPEVITRGANRGPPPADGPLSVLSAKRWGTAPGFVMRDITGRRYLVKFDPPGIPELTTGAELVSSRIFHALGWNVPEYHLVLLDPRRLRVAPDAWIREWPGGERAMTDDDLAAILERAAKRPGGRIRVSASRLLPGLRKGGFRTLGLRCDDANDTVPHEDRRELRGLRVVAAWLDHVDARRGNFHDAFVRRPDDPPGHGRVVHYLVDFSGTLGAWDVGWKAPKLGRERYVDFRDVLRIATLGLWRAPYEEMPLLHPALGRFGAAHFDPERWKPLYPNPLFDHATVRDRLWGAKLVASFTDGDLHAAIAAAEYSDPDASRLLARELAARQRTIARFAFDFRKINPADGFAVEGGELRFRDLAVESGVVAAASARYRSRMSGGEWVPSRATRVALGLSGGATAAVELETSHDAAGTWSPPTRITIAGSDVVAVERESRD